MIAASRAEEETWRWVFDAVRHSQSPNMAHGETKSVSDKCVQSHYVKGMESNAETGSSKGTKVGGDENWRTVECLRGRLLAERKASKAANETAENLGNKLTELESKLKEEIKLREKAERKLKLLKKKLQPFNISCTSGESDQSYSKDDFDQSRGSSTTNSVSKTSEDKVPKSQPANLRENASGASTPSRSQCAKDSSSQVTGSTACNSNINCTSKILDDTHCEDIKYVINGHLIFQY